METVVIVVHLMVIVALIAIVLLQRSEGGALGVGGANQFMTTRSQGNVLTRATTILGVVFFATSLLMSVLTSLNAPPTSILDTAAPSAGETVPATVPTTAPAADTGAGGGGILNELNRFTSGAPQTAPSTSAPDTSAPAGSQVPTSQ